jgi:hypothetical protein
MLLPSLFGEFPVAILCASATLPDSKGFGHYSGKQFSSLPVFRAINAKGDFRFSRFPFRFAKCVECIIHFLVLVWFVLWRGDYRKRSRPVWRARVKRKVEGAEG